MTANARMFAGCTLFCMAVLGFADPPSGNEEQEAFFEAKIRPVLIAHCYECHSASSELVQGQLRLDSSEGWQKGGDSGPAIVPGNPADSLVMRALCYDELEMPPSGKLADEIVADFEQWIKMGAFDPRVNAKPNSEKGDTANAPPPTPPRAAEAGSHWAFQAIVDPAMPSTIDRSAKNALDAHLGAKLAQAGLSLRPAVDRRTLLRRLWFNLVGLPPTSDDLQRFQQDDRADAIERTIDELLASPAYGERWGRHWLDVARYADTKDGVLMYGDDRLRPFAYTYRDYVIRSFNEDTPYGTFLKEQIAADQVEPRPEPWRLAAMGYLTLGRMFDNNVHDQIDDKIDTVTRGMLGLTVACARCHDHKYDPITQKDYYALYGVFANSETPTELPLTHPEIQPAESQEIETQLAAKRKEIDDILTEQFSLLSGEARKRIPDYLERVASTKPDIGEVAIFFLSLQPEDLRPPIVRRWRQLVSERAVADDPVFGLWHELMKPAPEEWASASPAIIDRWLERPKGTEAGQANPLIADAFRSTAVQSRAELGRRYGEAILAAADRSPLVAGVSQGASAEDLALDRARDQLARLVDHPDSPSRFPRGRTRDFMSRQPKDAFGGKLQELDKMALAPHARPRGMALVDAETIVEPRVFLRGSPAALGPSVVRRFLETLGGRDEEPFTRGSGRLELADKIASPTNPLTWRVLVNRVWLVHFGEPLVANPSDWGLRTSPPKQRELLDYLASYMLEQDQSLKGLHRLIGESQAFAQPADADAHGKETDPENSLFGHWNRRRLDLEAMRDSVLATAGTIDRSMEGPPVDVVQPTTRRRTVYGLVDRQSLPSLFRSFDFASPDQSAERRPSTTVPQQALFSMNSPFMQEEAAELMRGMRTDVDRVPQAAEIDALYRRILLRPATEQERTWCETFFQEGTQEGERPQALFEQWAHVLLMSNEFWFVD